MWRTWVAGVSACGAAALLVRCGGTTFTSSPGGGGDGGADAANEDAGDGDASFSGFDAAPPCSPDAAFPPDLGSTFACGSIVCHAGSEYCFSASGGAKKGPSILGCRPFLECGPACTGAVPSCACTPYSGGNGACTCTEDAGDFFVDCSLP